MFVEAKRWVPVAFNIPGCFIGLAARKKILAFIYYLKLPVTGGHILFIYLSGKVTGN